MVQYHAYKYLMTYNIYHTGSEIMSQLDNNTVDPAEELTPTPETP